ncbi:hypothetical protein EYF80_064423 [Liparis tanakae]|uniref:Uncharacterized protein n=1 Tax=Liparis tanakae TaxID=230148 RepID=A0A4Z2E9C2_9TELE|nr:hypothetical protein EYF80_064423 [Liparis tanakae]
MTLCSSGTCTCTSVWSSVSREMRRTLTRLEKSRTPVGQAQDVALGRGRQRWLQPPFLRPQRLKPGRRRQSHESRRSNGDSPSGLSRSTAWMSIRPGRLARTVMVLVPELLSARWMLRLCQSVQ